MAHPPLARGRPGLGVRRPAPGGREFGTKGASVGQTLQWRYPKFPYSRTPQPEAGSARLPFTWHWYLAPMRQEETGMLLWRPTWHGRVQRWDDPPPAGTSARTGALPSSRGRRPPAGPTPWGWTYAAGCGIMTPPASPPPPLLGREVTWRGGKLHAQVAYGI